MTTGRLAPPLAAPQAVEYRVAAAVSLPGAPALRGYLLLACLRQGGRKAGRDWHENPFRVRHLLTSLRLPSVQRPPALRPQRALARAAARLAEACRSLVRGILYPAPDSSALPPRVASAPGLSGPWPAPTHRADTPPRLADPGQYWADHPRLVCAAVAARPPSSQRLADRMRAIRRPTQDADHPRGRGHSSSSRTLNSSRAISSRRVARFFGSSRKSVGKS